MNEKPGSLYIPMEDLLYALSSLTGYKVGPWNFRHRLYALTEFIDTLILSNRLITDATAEDAHDREVLDLLNYFQLEKAVHPEFPPLLTASEFVLNMDNGIDRIPIIQALQDEKIQSPDLVLLNFSKWLDDFGFGSSDAITGFITSILNTSLGFDSCEHFIHQTVEAVADHIIIAFSTTENGDDAFFKNLLSLIEMLAKGFPLAKLHSTDAAVQYLRSYANVYHPESGDLSEGLIKDWLKSIEGRDVVFADIITRTMTSMYRFIAQSGIRYAQEFQCAHRPYSLKSSLITRQPLFAPSSKVFLNKLEDEKYKELARLNDFLYNQYSRTVRLPILFDYLLAKANSPKEIVKVALDLREEKFARSYRKWCQELDEALMAGNQYDSIRMIDETERYIAGLTKHLSIMPQQVEVQVSFPPAVSFALPISGLQRKGHLIFLEKVYRGSLNPLIHADKVQRIFGFEIKG